MNLKYYLRGLGIGILVTSIIMLILSYQNRQPMTDSQIKQRAKELGMVDENTTLSSLKDDKNDIEVVKLDETQDEKATEEPGPIDNEDEKINTEDENKDTNEAATDNTEANELVDTIESDTDLDHIENMLDEADAYLEDKNNSSKKETPTPKVTPTKEPSKTTEPVKTKEPESTKEPKASASPKVEATKTPKATPTKEPKEDVSANAGETVTLVISSGESSYTVAKNLAKLGIIDDANAFDDYLCSTGVDRRIRTGTFEISKNSSNEDIAKKISGK